MDWQSGQVSPFAFKRTGDADFPDHLKTLILGPPKAGKGLANGTPVRTPDGWTSIEDLQVGDVVQGQEGPTEVVGVFPQGERDLYRVTTDDGGSVVCDDQHLWTVHPHGASPRTESTPTLLEKIRSNRRYAYLPMPEPIEQPSVDVPVNPYVMGLLLGDGGFTNSSIHFHKADPELHDALRALLPADCTVGEWSDQHNTLRITGLTTYVRALGLSGKPSWQKFVPEPYLRGSVAQRLHLLAGLLDTDGGMNGRSTCFYTSSPSLRDDVVELVRSLGGVATVHEKENPRYAYRGEQRMGRAAYNVSIRLPGRFGCPFKLARKALAWDSGVAKRPPTRRITDITYVGRGESTCIKVADSNGLFLTQDYLVTHNTSLLATFPNIVVADVEAGLMSIAHLNIPYVTIDDPGKLQSLLFVLRDDALRQKAAEQMGMEKIESVGLDTMDALQDLFKKHRLQTERKTQFQQADWGWLLDQFRELIRAFVKLPLHVALTCHTKTVQVDENRSVLQPGLQGAIAEEIAGMVSFSMLMERTREVDQATGTPYTAYRLKVEGDDSNPHLGNRAAGRLSGNIEPSFQAVYNAVYENLKLAKQQQGEIGRGDGRASEPVEAAVPEATPTQTPANGPPADDEPINAGAKQHLAKFFTEFGFVLPDDVDSWTMGHGRMIAKMFVAEKEDVAAGKSEGGQEGARERLKEFLVSQGAYQDPEKTPPSGTIDELMEWVGDDPERAALALAREKATKQRKTALQALQNLLAQPPTSEPESTPETEPEGVVEEGQEPLVTEAVADEAPGPEPEPEPEASSEPTPEEVDAVVTNELDATLIDEQPASSNGRPSKAELMRIEDLAQAPPCEETGKPVDDLDIAKLSLSRFDRWLSVDAYIQETKKARA